MTEKIFGADEFRDEDEDDGNYLLILVEGSKWFILKYKGSYEGYFDFGDRACFFEIMGGEWDGVRVMISPKIVNQPWVKFFEELSSVKADDASSYNNMDIEYRVCVAIEEEKERLKKWGIE